MCLNTSGICPYLSFFSRCVPLSEKSGELVTHMPRLIIHMGSIQRSRKIQALPKIYAPNGLRYIQQPHLQIPSGQVGLLEQIPGAPASNPQLSKPTNIPTQSDTDIPVVISLHHRKCVAQTNCWTTEVIPRLVRPYLRMMRETQNLRVEPHTTDTECTCLVSGQVLSVLVVRLYSKK